jgi:hypothetical protein
MQPTLESIGPLHEAALPSVRAYNYILKILLFLRIFGRPQLILGAFRVAAENVAMFDGIFFCQKYFWRSISGYQKYHIIFIGPPRAVKT